LGRGVEHRILAHLGKEAKARQLAWVDIHFTPSGRNKPALDFLESVGGAFKQPHNGGVLFRFPSGFAAEVTFSPDTAPPEATTSSSLRTASVTAGKQTSFPNCRAIALTLNSAEAIHTRLQRSTSVRSRVGMDYQPPRNPIERQLCTLWQELLHIDKVGITDNFFDLGGHSLMAVRLFAELEKTTGRKLPLITLFQAPTVEKLAQLLSQGTKSRVSSLLVPIQPEGTKPPLMLVHGAGGDVLWGYANLAEHLGNDQPVYGIRSRGQAGLEEPTTLEEMAGTYLQEIQKHQPHGPYYLGGYCFGGNVAFEIARQLSARGEEVALVALLDSAPSNAGYESMRWWQPSYAVRFARNLACWWEDFGRLPQADRRRFFVRKASAFARKGAQWFSSKRKGLVDLDEVIDVSRFPEQDLKLWQAHLQALVEHHDQPYDGPVVLLRTRGQPLFSSLEEDFCWGKLAPQLRVKRIPGSHEEIFMPPHVQRLARELAGLLQETHATSAFPRPAAEYRYDAA